MTDTAVQQLVSREGLRTEPPDSVNVGSEKPLSEYAHEILSAGILPPKVIVAIDAFTENLIIHDGERGFNVTRKCLEEWELSRVLADLQAAAEDLVSGRESDVVRLLPVTSLLEMRKLPCAFDGAKR